MATASPNALRPGRSLRARAWRDPLPGFGLTFGVSLAWLGLIVMIPLSALLIRAAGLGWDGWLAVLSSERVWLAMRLTFGASFMAAVIASVLGTLIAWVLVRYSFPGRRLFDAMVDLPFALPTAVAGIALTALYSRNGWIGQFLEPIGIKVAQTPVGIVLALVFISLPFAVRTVQPLMESATRELEEAAATLGASRARIIRKVVLPPLLPAIVTGFGLAFARSVGEYGSVIFIAGNIPFVSEIVPLLIVIRLEEFDYLGATGVATLMLVVSFICLLLISLLHRSVSYGAAR